MHDAIADKLRMFQSRNQGEYTFLFRELEVCLEANQIIKGSFPVFRTQLNHCPWTASSMRVGQSHWFERPITQGICSALCHYLYRHAAFIYLKFLFFKFVKICRLGIDQLVIKQLILFFVHRAVDIVVFAPAIASSKKYFVLIKRLKGHNRCCRIKEGKIFLTA